MRCGNIGSCQSAATSEIAEVLLVTSLTHVSGAITSVQTFTFTFVTYIWYNEGWGHSPHRPLLAVPNVTAHPPMASVPTNHCIAV